MLPGIPLPALGGGVGIWEEKGSPLHDVWLLLVRRALRIQAVGPYLWLGGVGSDFQ